MSRAKQSMDGNTAAAHVAYAYTEVAGIYPITPSSPMADTVDQWSAAGQKNIFGSTVKVVEMESEAGAAGTVHGSLAAGALTTTFTASQGLLLMIPNMYKIAGENLPCVFDVSARTVSSHALNIFGDHSDVYACRQTGFAMLCETNPQEVMDLSPVAHCAALEGKVPFINFFDGFRTSHEIQKIEKWDYEDLKEMCPMDAVAEFRAHALNPEHPAARGSHENGDIFFQHREACNKFYDELPAVVEKYMDKVNAKLGTDYKLFNYYGAPDADRVIIAMGSINDVAEEVIDYLTAKGEKVGLIKVRLYRPWSSEALLNAIPKTAKKIAVLDRTKEPGSLGEPLYLDVATTLREAGMNDVVLVGGRYGLGSKDTPPSSVFAVYTELEKDAPKHRFTIGIVDDVTNLSLPEVKPAPITSAPGTKECKFWGLGGDGTVGANKNSVQIIGNNTNKYCQAYFSYDSKKSGGFTCSHLRFGDSPIHSAYQVNTPNFVACHVQAYLNMYDVTRGLRKNGYFLLNTIFDGEELVNFIPNKVKRIFAQNNITVYYINATKIAQEIGLGNRTNTILQSAFFRITEVIPLDLAVEQMKAFIVKSYSKKGQDVVDKNFAAVDRGGEYKQLTVDPAWANLADEEAKADNAPAFVKELVRPINGQAGDLLKVSDFVKHDTVDGTWQNGTAAFEKRGVEAFVPVWNVENCIQCNKCSFVCPHAAIRPFVLTDEELAGIEGLETQEIKAPAALKGMHFRIETSVLDCLGCGNCADVCPGKKNKETGELEKALKMVPFNVDAEDMQKEVQNWEYLVHNVASKQDLVDIKQSPKNSQFAQPLFEFSGACSGCGETPYVKLISQLFGDRQMIANATGCSSIYSASIPSTPYTTNAKGQGPAFDNSLFEDFCEFGLGMVLGNKKMKERICHLLEEAKADEHVPAEFVAAADKWMANMNDSEGSKAAAAELKPLIAAGAEKGCPVCAELKTLDHYLVKRSQWIIGGDGASYDIGYGGLDHVLASGEDVNILVLDTEVYSNTGGQSSKSTPLGAIAQFAAQGKRIRKKDLGLMQTTYGYIYVAQIAMGADNAQTLKAIREAEAYPGPSLIIAYAPCINHGLKRKGGMGRSQNEEKLAVDCGYWHLWRFNPLLADEGKNPFTLDSKAPKWEDFRDFLLGEVRYLSVQKAFPKEADELFSQAEKMAKLRYQTYVRKSQENWSEQI